MGGRTHVKQAATCWQKGENAHTYKSEFTIYYRLVKLRSQTPNFFDCL